MALVDKLRTAAAPHLRPGEQIQAVFPAQRANPKWVLVSVFITIAKGWYVVVATDQRILVFRTSRWFVSRLKDVAKELPRSTRFGDPSGVARKKIQLDGENVWVSRPSWPQLRLADAAIGA
jgi:hypothetical protein